MMNSATLKPVSSQNPSVPNQINKPMHPQSNPTYTQPSGHMPQNPYPNMNVAHNHPNAQQNHFSLNVPSAPSHYTIGSIPPSNHPVANVSQSATGLQSYTPPKTVPYSGSYQSSLSNSPNQTTSPPPPVQQTSPQNLSHSSSTSPGPTEETSEKPQSNGTPEEKAAPSEKMQDNHVPSESSQQSQQQTTVSPQVSPQVVEKPKELPIEKPTLAPSVQEPKPSPEPTKVPEAISSSPIQVATQLTPQQPETDPLAIDASETVPSPSKPEDEETSEIPTEDPLPEESSEPASIEAAESRENSSEDVAATDADKDNQESDEANTEKNIENVVESNTEMDVDKDEEDDDEEEEQETAQIIPETKPVSAPRETKKSTTVKPKDATKPVKVESKTPLPKTPTSSKAVEKRQRTRTQPYQSPLPEIEIITKIISTTPKSKSGDDKLIYFYKNEFLAVRNAEGSFYLCQATQNIYKSSSKIKIRWLSQDKNDKTGEIYTPDFYDLTDFDCILTSLDLVRVDKGKYRLTQAEKERTDSILKRSLAVEKGEIVSPSVSQEHPDGLDLSLYKDEEQLKKKSVKRKASSSRTPKKATPTKKSPQAPKVRKVETKVVKKVVTPPTRSSRKSNTSVTAAVTTPAPVTPQRKPPPPEPKKTTASTSRAARSKRKSDTKTSPVVDQKKAKVLAKIGRKTAIPASTSRSQSTTGKSGKVAAKPAPSTTRAAVATTNAKSGATTRKNKRSSRK